MADLTITAASVVKGSGSVVETGTAGASVTAGQVVYKDASDSNKFKLADCDSATAAVRSPYGIALHASGSGQPLTVLRSGPITIGATVSAGVAYYLSATPGGIAPVADLATGDYPVILGIATSTTVLEVDIQEAGVALA
jgi:hypothetical protein